MVAATTPMPSRQIDVNHGVDAAPRRFERIVFKISTPDTLSRPAPKALVSFSGFPRQSIVPTAARLATLVAKRVRA
jgi:hypothetical protein